MSIQKIKTLYTKLSPEEQRECIYQLNHIIKPMKQDIGKTISEFCINHQKEFKQDVIFKSQITEAGFLVQVQTTYGKFTGTGPYKKMAKLNAIREAQDARKPVAEKITKPAKRKSAKTA